MLYASTDTEGTVRGRLITIFCAALLCSPALTIAEAQGHAAKQHVTFALVDTIGHQNERAMVVRRGSGEPRNLILIRATTATVADVATGLGVLAERQSNGDALTTPEERIAINTSAFRTSNRDQILLWMDILSKLKAAPVHTVTGFGKIPAISVALELVPRTRHSVVAPCDELRPCRR
jgi:hypothetical protein